MAHLSEHFEYARNAKPTKYISSSTSSSVMLVGVVEKIVRAPDSVELERAQISLNGAEPLYKEIRIDNALKNAVGEKVKLRPGDEVNITISLQSEKAVPEA